MIEKQNQYDWQHFFLILFKSIVPYCNHLPVSVFRAPTTKQTKSSTGSKRMQLDTNSDRWNTARLYI